MTNGLNPSTTFQGPSTVEYTTHREALDRLGADGTSAAPPGTTAVPVNPGDTISELIAGEPYSLDWNDPAVRQQFLLDNPQFATPEALSDHPELAGQAGGRNPDQIWPGEVIYVRNPGASSPEATATDAAARKVASNLAAAEDATFADDRRNLANSPVHQEFTDAVQAEIDATKVVPENPTRADVANAIVAAAERIAQRLEAAGLDEQAARARQIGSEQAAGARN